MTYLKKLSKVSNRLMASATVLVLGTGVANAQISAVSAQIESELTAIPSLLTQGAYVLGAGLSIAGLFKLKSYVEDKSGDDLQASLIRLGVGGLLLVLPFVLQTSQDTVGATSGTVTTGTL